MSTTRTSFEIERQELDAILVSGFLDRNSNAGRLLEYLCQKHFDGTENDIKENNIAIDVFGRSADFDRRRDSIVRVEASRLRKRLDDYYAAEGLNRPLRISIPPGQYVPQFSPRQIPVPDVVLAPDPDPLQPRHRLSSPLVFALLLIAAAAVAGSVYWMLARAKAVAPRPPIVALPPTPEVRILAGYDKEKYVDRQGRIWLGDRYFKGGDSYRPEPSYIARTLDPTLFQSMRTGTHFLYDIPLQPGAYQLQLYFVEIAFGASLTGGGGELSRMMHVRANGKTILPEFDVYSDAGGDHVADVRSFKNINPAPDGFLHLSFESIFDKAFVNAISVVPMVGGKSSPIRMVARETFYTDHAGQVWAPDNYFIGGKLVLRKQYIKGSGDADLYLGERFGRLDYAIPVPPGKYAVTLRFSEQWFKDGPGHRVFNVFSNGLALLRNFDIYREAGGALRPFDRTFHNIEPNAQGKIELSFIPVVNYACINAIEITDESP